MTTELMIGFGVFVVFLGLELSLSYYIGDGGSESE